MELFDFLGDIVEDVICRFVFWYYFFYCFSNCVFYFFNVGIYLIYCKISVSGNFVIIVV